MSHTESGSIAIGECVFDTSRGLLLRQGHPVKLRPKTFALLSHLVGKTGHVVSKSELMESVWPGLFVTEDSLTQGVRELRKALRDDSQSIIAPSQAAATSFHRLARRRGRRPTCLL
ncbi:winged helix-turn-helix domain-containing protein [Mesorhizobium sp. M0058]|uniref:winged helix-turn-helix domain-containing protein n=1 Tax=Mesorhizobium sp. M0058 TaxID=2956865 RepID=UPI00333662B4